MTPVWHGMDLATLDREYNARATVPDFEGEMKRYRDLSSVARESLRMEAELVFDAGSGEALDWFAGAANGPVLLWIHGGYWRALSRSDQSCVAPGLVAAGVHVAVIDYSLAPAATLDEILRQVRAAVSWVHAEAAIRGADPARLFVGGSSAGAHLAAMAMAPGWAAPAIRGCLALSGLYDLDPIRLSHINAWLSLDEAAARRLSPMHHIPPPPAPRLLVSYGGLETAEFQWQSEAFAAAWSQAGHEATVLPQPPRHHFDIVLGLGDPEDPLCRAACRFMMEN